MMNCSTANLMQSQTKEITLNEIISKLESLATKHKINKLQWLLYDKIFRFWSIEEFKHSCIDSIKSIIIALIRRPKHISSADEKYEILNKFHNDPLYGGHFGQKRL